MSDASDSPAGSFWSILGTALLHGCAILFLLLVATLVGWIAGLNATLAAWMEDLMGEKFAHTLPGAVSWMMTVLIAFGLPSLMLSCRHGWQRLTIWLSSIAILALWAPVLCLAAHRPDVSLAWLSAALAGLFVTIHLFWSARSRRR